MTSLSVLRCVSRVTVWKGMFIVSLLVCEPVSSVEELLSRQPVIWDVAGLPADEVVRHDAHVTLQQYFGLWWEANFTVLRLRLKTQTITHAGPLTETENFLLCPQGLHSFPVSWLTRRRPAPRACEQLGRFPLSEWLFISLTSYLNSHFSALNSNHLCNNVVFHTYCLFIVAYLMLHKPHRFISLELSSKN